MGTHTSTSTRLRVLATAGARLAITCFAISVVAAPTPLEAQTTSRVSVATGGIQGTGFSSGPAAMGGNGRFVVFSSDAPNLVVGDTNASVDIFLHDRLVGTTSRVSVGTAGTQSNADSFSPTISDDGRFVAFYSYATNLVAADNNGDIDVFVHDRQLETTTRVSVAANGAEGNGRSSTPFMTSDGRYISFWSNASNLVPNDTNHLYDVFVHDRQAGTIRRVSVATGGAQAGGDLGISGYAPVSADGRFIFFISAASNVVVGETNRYHSVSEIFVRDQQTGTTSRLISADVADRSYSLSISPLSADGRYLVFQSSSSRLVAGDTNDTADIFLHDRVTGATSRLTDGQYGFDGQSDHAVISADGRHVVFESHAANLVSHDTNNTWDVFAHDRSIGVTTRISVGPLGEEQFDVGRFMYPTVSADGRLIGYVSAAANLVVGDTNGFSDVFVHDLDADGDGLMAPWETTFGLNPLLDTGDDGATGDPDGDGRTNAQEQEAATHPRGVYTRYLAEGATSSFFDTRVALLNPGGSTTALLRFQKADGTSVARAVSLNGLARATVNPRTANGLTSAEFATVIESDGPVVVDRLMTWDVSGYGSHAETAISAPSTTWYLAEGATHHNFSLFYLVQNPNGTSVPVTVTYLLPAPAAPLTRVYTVPAQSRFNIWVNNEGAVDPALAILAATDVSAVITATQPILVERAMYLTQAGPDGQFGTPDDIVFGAGHESAGVTAPALTWFLAEGATGPYFDEFLLIANPTATAAAVEVRYLLGDGTVLAKPYTVPAQSRFNIWVNEEEFPGQGKVLADAALSATLTSTNSVPIIVERSMWWPRPSPTWMEAHNTPGTTTTGTRWGLAEGEVGGAAMTETYILIANTSSFAGTARVTVVIEGGGTQVVDVPLPANSRTNVPAIESWFPGVAGRRFGALIDSLGATPAQIVVERAMYSNANGVHWAAGSNATATRLQP